MIIKKEGADLVEHVQEEGWTYIKTVVDIVREPILILDKNLCVLAANEPFYRTFQVDQNETEGTVVYKLGNGQWDIPTLRKLLEEIVPKNTFFKGFEVAHEFPSIGRKVMILNARQIHFKGGSVMEQSPIILLAIEDVTEMMSVARQLAEHTNEFQTELTGRTKSLEAQLKELEEKVNSLTQPKKGKK